MSTQPEISVLLPAYNAVTTLKDAIESVLAQTLREIELLVIDDGSDDGTAELLASMTDPRMRVLSRPHHGLVAALNHGIEQARAPYLARMDADDASHPQRLAAQLELIGPNAKLGAVGCCVEMFPNSEVQAGMRHYLRWLNSLLTPEDHARNIFVEMPLLHPSMLMRTAAVRALGGYRKGLFPEDYDLLLRMHTAGWHFAKVPEVLYRWREHGNRLSRNSDVYSSDAFQSLKARHLAQTILQNGRPFRIWGAGRDGRRMCRALEHHRCKPLAFIDIDPAKIGRLVRGMPVVSKDAIPADGTLVLVSVGTKGARELIRTFLNENGYSEGESFLCIT